MTARSVIPTRRRWSVALIGWVLFVGLGAGAAAILTVAGAR